MLNVIEKAEAEGYALERALRPKEAAEYLGCSISLLSQLRQKGQGPRWCSPSARIVTYLPSDLRAYQASRMRTQTKLGAEDAA